MNSIFKKFLLILFMLTCLIHKGQQNKNYYLIDSVDVKTLSKSDKTLMDSILKLYYKADQDTTKLQLLDFLSNNCSELIWSKYNDYIYNLAESFLKNNKHLSPAEFKLIKGTSANCLVNKGTYISDRGDLEEAMALYKRGLLGFKEAGDKLGESNALSNIASLYVHQNKIDKAIDLMNKNIILLKELNNERALLNTYNNLGVVYRNQGQFEKALESFYKCLGLEEKNGETKLLCAVLLNIGTLNNSLKEIDVAVQYYNRCLEISERIDYKVGVAKALEHLALVFQDRNDLEKALSYNLRSLKIKEELKNYKGMAYTYGNIAMNYQKMKKYSEAESNFLKAAHVAEQSEDLILQANTLKNVGNFYVSRNELQKAKNYGLQSLDISKKLSYPENIQLSANLLKDIYEKTGDWKNAFKMQELSKQMSDSILNSSTQKAALKNKLEYEYQKEKLADSLTYAKQKEVKDLVISEQEAQLSKEKAQRFALLGILTLALILFIVLYRSYQAKQKTNEIILEQKVLVEQKNTENELLLGEIHHRVKNNLQVISSLLSLQERSMEKGSAKSAIHEGKERVRSMELVHKMLYQGNSFSGIEMHDYVNKLSTGLLESFGLTSNNVEVVTEFKSITLDVDAAIPLGLILNELIVNSLKHARSTTEKLILKIEIQEDKAKQLQMTIEDNGKGKVSEIETSNSFGLKIIRALVRQLDGVMEIKEDNGIHYSIALKNYKLIA